MNIFETCKKNHGSVTNDGIEYAIFENAHADNFGTDGGVCYKSLAFSRAQLNEYCAEYGCDDSDIDLAFACHAVVVWIPFTAWIERCDTDESSACDWAAPYSVSVIG